MVAKNVSKRAKGGEAKRGKGRLPKAESSPNLMSSLNWTKRSYAEALKHLTFAQAELERTKAWIDRCDSIVAKVGPAAEALKGMSPAPSTTRASITHRDAATKAAKHARTGQQMEAA